MKKALVILLALALSLALTASAVAEASPILNTITVSGNASVTLAADMGQLQIGAEIRAATVHEAQAECSRIIADVLKAMKENGIADKDIVTSNYNISSWNDYQLLTSDGQPTLTYSVSSMLEITVRDLTTIGKLIDDATKVGANTTYGISFMSSQTNDAYIKALARAVEDAKTKAAALAEAAGLMVGEIMVIDASQADYSYGFLNNTDARASVADGATIISGDVSVTATVNMTFGMIR